MQKISLILCMYIPYKKSLLFLFFKFFFLFPLSYFFANYCQIWPKRDSIILNPLKNSITFYILFRRILIQIKSLIRSVYNLVLSYNIFLFKQIIEKCIHIILHSKSFFVSFFSDLTYNIYQRLDIQVCRGRICNLWYLFIC